MTKAKTIPFSKEELQSMFTYRDGFLYWNRDVAYHKKAGSRVGRKVSQKRYLQVCIDYISYPAHRLIWKLHHGVDPSNLIDHINGNKGDNRIENLRDVNYNTNNTNTYRNKYGGEIPNIYFTRNDINPYMSTFQIKGKKIYLGYFRTKEDAALALAEAKKLYSLL